jgi:hypothetical protein
MAGYTRQSSLNNGDIITAALFNNEYNQLLAAFNVASGHKHDGTTAEGPVIGLIGDAGLATPLNKILIDTTNDEIGFHIDVSGTSTEQFKLLDGAIVPITDNDIDLGTSSLEFKDAFFDGTVTLDGLVIGSATSITDVDTDLTSVSASDDTLASAKAIKTYVDAQVTVQDLDFSGDTGGSQAVDLDSQSLTLTGGTGINTTGSAQTMTFAIDSTVATLTDSQTLTNKVLDIDNNTLSNVEVDNLKSGVLDTDLTSVSGSDDTLASAKAIKTYVDSQVTAQDLDFQGDTGGALNIDLDSETLTLAGGTGINSVGAGNGVTFNIDSTVATLTGSQTLTNKTLTTPVISTISNSGTITLPTSTDTLVGKATTDTLTNKTLTSAVLNDTISGTSIKDEDNMSSNSASHLATQQSIKAYVDTQVATVPVGDITSVVAGTGLTGGGTSGDVTLNIDSTVATLTGSQTLTNKTLTSPVLDTSISGTAFKDEDDMTSNSATSVASQQSIKAYVDSQVATANELSELTDVNITSPADGGLLFYDTATSKWIDNVVSGDITIADTGVAAINSGVIVNADINASAAIDATKIHDGSVDNTEFSYINGVTSSIQTQLDGKASNGFSIAMAIAL